MSDLRKIAMIAMMGAGLSGLSYGGRTYRREPSLGDDILDSPIPEQRNSASARRVSSAAFIRAGRPPEYIDTPKPVSKRKARRMKGKANG